MLAHPAKFEKKNKICQQDTHSPHMQYMQDIFWFLCLFAGKTLDTLLCLVSQPTACTPPTRTRPSTHPPTSPHLLYDNFFQCSCTLALLLAEFSKERKFNFIFMFLLCPDPWPPLICTQRETKGASLFL